MVVLSFQSCSVSTIYVPTDVCLYDGYKHSLDLLVVTYVVHCKNKSLITLVSCAYGEIFHSPSAREISPHISR